MKPLSDFVDDPILSQRLLPVEALEQLEAEVVVDDLLRVRCVRMPDPSLRQETDESLVPDWASIGGVLDEGVGEAS